MDNNAAYCQISIIGPGQFEPNMRLNEYQLKNINGIAVLIIFLEERQVTHMITKEQLHIKQSYFVLS